MWNILLNSPKIEGDMQKLFEKLDENNVQATYLFLTGGDQPQWGAYSRVFGMLTDSRQQKYEIEMARELATMSCD